jgi:hypothetical protein
MLFYCFALFSEVGSQYVGQVDLELMILQLLPQKLSD